MIEIGSATQILVFALTRQFESGRVCSLRRSNRNTSRRSKTLEVPCLHILHSRDGSTCSIALGPWLESERLLSLVAFEVRASGRF